MKIEINEEEFKMIISSLHSSIMSYHEVISSYEWRLRDPKDSAAVEHRDLMLESKAKLEEEVQPEIDLLKRLKENYEDKA
jgi:hypothetical protein